MQNEALLRFTLNTLRQARDQMQAVENRDHGEGNVVDPEVMARVNENIESLEFELYEDI